METLVEEEGMTRTQGVICIVAGLFMAIGGYVAAAPDLSTNFWVWMTMPALMFIAGIVRLLRP